MDFSSCWISNQEIPSPKSASTGRLGGKTLKSGLGRIYTVFNSIDLTNSLNLGECSVIRSYGVPKLLAPAEGRVPSAFALWFHCQFLYVL
jgi:hypothetical protein